MTVHRRTAARAVLYPVLGVAQVAGSAQPAHADDHLPWQDASLSPEERADLLTDAMTLDQTISQLIPPEVAHWCEVCLNGPCMDWPGVEADPDRLHGTFTFEGGDDVVLGRRSRPSIGAVAAVLGTAPPGRYAGSLPVTIFPTEPD